ncbi:AMP-binding protein [Pseudodesulfovibrio cashew]|uniref:AMP-binding protein n=1 Tax=Pseudodesulfovibrio cashew TaxID=2678688 RepID=A0A6I6JML1_9BACT|nr:AMP-binding protein [Pseudodesulfovibrio cashew]QGY41492.1 AMP-binding protein [Pseudodesulfovibrio cashew]
MPLPVLDQWLVRRMGWESSALPSPGQLRDWQLARIRELIDHAKEGSPFYARHLADIDPVSVLTADDFSRLPAIGPEDLREGAERFLCVSQDEIARVVTLQSSGTTGKPKRVFYTREDLEGTVAYFGWGMRNLVGPEQTAMVLMPGERPGGVGRLLMDALSRTGARAVPHGIVEDARRAVDHCLECDAACIVGSPAHVNMLVREWERRGLPKNRIRSVLLCWDVTPEAVARNVADGFGCKVLRHWGMVETGLGGAVECSSGSGMHLREAELYLEIIEPETGRLLLDGEVGEIVVTTPLKLGMPLIRYRTGDMGRVLPGSCVCGSPMRRLDPLVYRTDDGILIDGVRLTLRELNETLYALPEVYDFAASYGEGVLRVVACGKEASLSESVIAALSGIEAVSHGVRQGGLRLEVEMKQDGAPAVPGLGKRCIQNI